MTSVPGRSIPSEAEFLGGRFDDPTMAWRRGVLRRVVNAFESADPSDHFLRVARANVERWRHESGHRKADAEPEIRVVAGDWGDVTLDLAREFGEVFAVLNMANAYYAGGGYVEGMVAQEENMFRRTDCHLVLSSEELDPDGRYGEEMSALINGESGRVYLDLARPRVCLRGPEIDATEHVGYRELPEDEMFPFYEVRAAARDYRDGSAFDEEDARRRIRAQLDTLRECGVRHAVLGASGCGAFRNPSTEIARIYREELSARHGAYACIGFAIYHAGYGPGNFEVFKRALMTS